MLTCAANYLFLQKDKQFDSELAVLLVGSIEILILSTVCLVNMGSTVEIPQ